MALSDHLRELRARLIRSALVLLLAFVVAWYFYDQLLELVLGPYEDAAEMLGGETDTTAYIGGATGPLMLQLKLSGVVAIVASSPYWLYQIWAFILPGLHSNERKWSRIFAAVAGPLFFIGVATGYYVLPKGLEVLIGFTPASAAEPRRVRRVLQLPDPDAARLRHLVRDPAVRDHAEPRRRGLRQAAGALPALDHHRDVRLRRRRHPVHRPLLDDHAGRADAGAVHLRRGRRPFRRQDPRPRRDSTDQWADDQQSPL